jgi:hypothetical protein
MERTAAKANRAVMTLESIAVSPESVVRSLFLRFVPYLFQPVKRLSLRVPLADIMPMRDSDWISASGAVKGSPVPAWA